MRLSQPAAGSGAAWLSTSANDSPLSLSATARLAPTNPPPIITTSKFMAAIISWRPCFIYNRTPSFVRGKKNPGPRPTQEGGPDPISVQIVGADPGMLAQAARYNVDRGAQIIDINMGCPARKICNVMAGSALLQNEPLVARLLEAVVGAVDVPVTLKIRTGWDKQNRNAIRIARIAEASGIQALAIHGRTRACAYTGDAEYDTIAAVKASVNIPIIANGDITTPEKAMM